MLTLEIPYPIVAIVILTVCTALGYWFGGLHTAPRNNAGHIYGFVLGLILLLLAWALIYSVFWLSVLGAAVAAAWFTFSLFALSHA